MTSDDHSKDQNVGTRSSSEVASAVHLRPELASAYVAPQTTLQEVLLTVWADILSIEKIGIEDDFFELGGDSVVAMQIVSRLRDMFRMDLPAILLFDAPTIEKLGHYIVAHESRPGLTEKTAALLKQIEGMTEEEVTRSLRSK